MRNNATRLLLAPLMLSLLTIPPIRVVASLTLRRSFVSTFTPNKYHGYDKHTARNLVRRRIHGARHLSFTSRSRITMMPEGPEVRTVIDQLQAGVGRRLVDIKFISGRYVRNGPPNGFRAFAKTMSRWEPPTDRDDNEESSPRLQKTDVIAEWNCKGKFIYVVLDDGSLKAEQRDADDFQRSMFITLGMSGRFVSEAVNEQDSRHARWFLELVDVESNASSRIYYHDQRNFGTLKFCLSKQALADKLESLGPDLLDPETTEEVFVQIVKAQRQSMNICKFLMNQSKIAGVGNYILAEGLYKSQIDPYCSLEELDEDKQRSLFRELKETALESYAAQGMTRQKGGQFRGIDGDRGKFEFELQCYGRQLCANGDPVQKDTNGPHGRTIWYTDRQLFMPKSRRSAAAPASAPAVKLAPKCGVLVSPGNELLAGLVDASWKNALSEAVQTESFQKLEQFLMEERTNGVTIYPPVQDIFSALNLCPFDRVKVVIVGQDPYHGPGQGHGLAFSVRRGVTPPPSLKNIFREAMDDVGIDPPPHGNLEHWARQGVLLLNTVLTVQQGKANSHAKHGWEEFTDAIIDKLNQEREGVVFLLWGNPAAKKAGNVDETRHVVIRTSHPSPLGATKTATPFLTSRCFSRANESLLQNRMEPIDWNVR